MSLLFIFVPSLISQTSIMILPAGAITIGLAWLIFRKHGTIELKKIREQEKQKEEGADSASGSES